MDLYYSIILIKVPFSIIVITKVICHWVFTGVPIIILSPIFLIFLSGSYENILALFLSLLLGTPLFSLLGIPFSALTLGATARAPMLIFLTIPFYLPVIIFGVLSASSFSNGSFSEYYFMNRYLKYWNYIFTLYNYKDIKRKLKINDKILS